MPRERTLFVCRECGYESAKWMGQCPSCKQWNTLEEVETPKISKSRSGKTVVRKIDEGRILPLKEIRNSSTYRIDTKIEELNRVLGGGIVPGSVVLAGGEPGIGKSTLFLQMADNIAKEEDVLYISGEESAEQVAMRFERLGLTSDLRFMAENQLEDILSAAETVRPKVMIVDSIQTIFDSDIESAAGSVSQVRECAARLARYAKSSEVAVIIIGHVTKEGNIAGPRILEHLVDTVLYFEGENQSAFRILRAVKNRFGSTNEIGVFDMKGTGMEEVTNPSQILLSTRQKDMPGSCIYCAVEGTRPVLLEVEALVSESSFGTPRRMTSGVDYNRVNLIVAVLEKRIGLKLYNQDIYVNIGGGMRIWDSALDLAIAASIVSSFRNKPLRQGIVLAGEIGLTGEVRHVSQIEKRIAEAARMGMEAIILPKSNYSAGIKDIEQIPIKTLHDALGNLF